MKGKSRRLAGLQLFVRVRSLSASRLGLKSGSLREKLVAVINAEFLATINAAVIGSTIGNASTTVNAALLYTIRFASVAGQSRSRTHANEDYRCRSEQCCLFHRSVLSLVTYRCNHIPPNVARIVSKPIGTCFKCRARCQAPRPAACESDPQALGLERC